MDLENSVCCYALHIGCLNANDPNCKRCMEGLKTAVTQTLHTERIEDQTLQTERIEEKGDFVTLLSELHP
jgi:hypothetical protein